MPPVGNRRSSSRRTSRRSSGPSKPHKRVVRRQQTSQKVRGRTPTEIGQTVPRGPKGEKRKARKVRAVQRNEAVQAVKRATRDAKPKISAEARASVAQSFSAPKPMQRLSKRGIVDDAVKAVLDTKLPQAETFGKDPLESFRPKTVGEAAEDAASFYAAAKIPKVVGAVGKAIKGPKAPKLPAKKAPTKSSPKKPSSPPKKKPGSKRKPPPEKPPLRVRAPKAAGRAAAKTAKRGAKGTARAPMRGAQAYAGAPVLPDDTAKRVRAFVEGTASANPVKSAVTTAKAIPGLFSFLGSAAGGTYRSAKEGSLEPLEGVAKGAGAMFAEDADPKTPGDQPGAIAKLASGDPEQVREATEDEVGYVFAPLAPRGFVWRPAKAVGRTAAKPVKATARKVVPAKVRHSQVVRTVGPKGRRQRKGVAKEASRTIAPAQHEGVAAAEDVVSAGRKAKGARSLTNRSGPEAAQAAGVMARYGITRKNPLARAKDTLRDMDKADVDYVNVRQTVEWLERNPRVLKDDDFWNTVREFHRATEPVETSPVAKFRAQGRVAGEAGPETYAPKKARELTGVDTRAGAWKALNDRIKAAAKARREGDKARGAAREAKGARAQELRDIAAAHRREFQRLSAEAHEIYKTLDPYSRPGVKPSAQTKRIDWDKGMADEFVQRVRTGRSDDLEDPAWLSEKDPGFQPEGGLGGVDIPTAGVRAPQKSAGKVERKDVADRSLPALLEGSVIAPRIQRGIHRFVRGVLDEFSEPVRINGRDTYVGSARQWNALPDEVKRRLVPVPSRQWKQAVQGEDFDLVQFHSDLAKRIDGDLTRLADEPGTSYNFLPREVATEMADQLNPTRHGMERVFGGIGTAGSRVVLFNPAWLAAQIVNETSQVATSVGVRGGTRAAVQLLRMWRRDPEGYRNLLHYSGDSMPSAQPIPPRLSMNAKDHVAYSDAARIARKTPVGRFFHDLLRLRTFGNIDRWKGVRLQAIVTAARANRELGKFTRGLAGMHVKSSELARKLAKMSPQERLSYLAREPKDVRQFLDYKDDVMGNFQAFTRFERQVAPLVAFYPYLRMSLRWTFSAFPKRHPVKAEILYLLSQNNREQLTKILGREPDFVESAMPVLYDDEGQPDAALVAGRRFGAPGMNALVEAVGQGNIGQLPNVMSPFLSTLYRSASGTNPFTGEQDVSPEDRAAYGLNALNNLMSMHALPRYAGWNTVGEEETELGKVFEAIDPQRAMRSAVNPFIPLSAERLRMQTVLSDALDDVSGKPEYGDLVDSILAGDKQGTRELAKRVDLADDAKKILEDFLGKPTKKEEDAVSQAGSIINEGTKALKPKKVKRTSSGTSGGGIFKDSGSSSDSSGGGIFK